MSMDGEDRVVLSGVCGIVLVLALCVGADFFSTKMRLDMGERVIVEMIRNGGCQEAVKLLGEVNK